MGIKYQRNFQPCPKCGEAMNVGSKTCASCSGKGRGSLVRRRFTTCVCKYCKSNFPMPEWRVKQGRGIFCSRECANKYLTTLSGEESPRWNGGYECYRGKGWRVAREWALIRACGKCEGCGETLQPGRYAVHHIKPYRLCKNDMEANSQVNLIALCSSCHATKDRLGRILAKKVGDAKGER